MSDTEQQDSARLFRWPDYLIFALTLLISSIVGIYYAWKGSGNSTSSYLMGGKKMTVFPIAMSLAARYFSLTSSVIYDSSVKKKKIRPQHLVRRNFARRTDGCLFDWNDVRLDPSVHGALHSGRLLPLLARLS